MKPVAFGFDIEEIERRMRYGEKFFISINNEPRKWLTTEDVARMKEMLSDSEQ
jgi:hypothetical protein